VLTLTACLLLPCRTEAREELRRQVGTLRFDLNTLASTKPKEAKKEALAARKEFIRAVSANTSLLFVQLRPCCGGSYQTCAAATVTSSQPVQHTCQRGPTSGFRDAPGQAMLQGKLRTPGGTNQSCCKCCCPLLLLVTPAG
jgi:hypothetical protein